MKILRIALITVAAGALLLPYFPGLLSLPEAPKPPSARRPGERAADFRLPLDPSVRGLHVARDVSARLEVFAEGAEPRTATPARVYDDLAFAVRDDSDWGPTVMAPQEWIDRQRYVVLRFDPLPDDPELWGRPARVVAAGTIWDAGHTETRPFVTDVTFSFADRAAAEEISRALSDYERRRDAAEKSIFFPVRRFMTHSDPKVVELACMVVAVIAGLAAFGIELFLRRRAARA